MNRHAVLITILFAYFVTIGSISYTVWAFYKLNTAQHTNNIFTKHNVISQVFLNHFQKNTSVAVLEANLAIYDLHFVKEKSFAATVLEKAEVLKERSFNTINSDIFYQNKLVLGQQNIQKVRAVMLQYKSKIYFYIQSNRRSVLLEERILKPYKSFNLLYTYLSIIFVITFSFILILRRLQPLQRLHKKIRLFGKGDMNISFKMRSDDEIATISNELEMARVKISDLMESRTLFLRNIMHELKTPITKGRILSQMVKEDKQRDRFDTIFARMEGLIAEFAMIEEVSTGFSHLKTSEYRYLDLVDGAIDMAMIDSSDVISVIDTSKKIEVDYSLFITAIKNMIDNALKYSPDTKVTLGTQGDELWFENRGERLKHPLSHYVQAFTKDSTSGGNRDSFGLGLYLVDAILKAHNRVLAYEYRDGINRFIFVPIKD